MKLRIAEIFHSIQGEGQWAGVPSTFVRVSGCNLRCVWCDTPYASWNPEGPVQTIDEILAVVNKQKLDHVVLTGGEPMLFDPIEDLAHALKALGKTITIETAGTIYRDLPCDLMSISPKLTNSIPVDNQEWANRHDETRLQIEVLAKLTEKYPYQVKFVIQDLQRDLDEIDQLLAQIPNLESNRIMLMPEGRNSDALWQMARTLVSICMERNWRLAPRLQIDLFGDTKGT